MTYALFVVLAVLGALVALGLFYRPRSRCCSWCSRYLQLVDVTNYLNHYYLVSLLAVLLFFIPAHRAFSLDARLRPAIRSATLPAWCTYLLRSRWRWSTSTPGWPRRPPTGCCTRSR